MLLNWTFVILIGDLILMIDMKMQHEVKLSFSLINRAPGNEKYLDLYWKYENSPVGFWVKYY